MTQPEEPAIKLATTMGKLPLNLVQAFRLCVLRRVYDRLALRGTCRALRELHDEALEKLCLGRYNYKLSKDNAPSPDQVAATIRGILARGCRPKNVSFFIKNMSECEELMLAFLDGLAGTKTVKSFDFHSETPLSAAVARVVVSAIPNLSSVNLSCEPSDDAVMAFRPEGELLLMQLAGPKLKGIGIYTHGKSYWPAQAVQALTLCTALTSLSLYLAWDDAEPEYGLTAESSLLRTLPSLTGLRDLRLWGGVHPPDDAAARQARAATLESGLSALTALTNLDIHWRCLDHVHHPHPEVPDEHEVEVEAQVVQLRADGRAEEAERLLAAVAAESRALGAALRCMPHLETLRTQARLNAADLAPLTALTYLRLGEIVLDPPPQGAAAADVEPLYDLPQSLKELKIYAPLRMSVAASLRRHPAAAAAGAPLIYWRRPGFLWDNNYPQWRLEFDADDVDGQGRLTASALLKANLATANLKALFKRGGMKAAAAVPCNLRLELLGSHSVFVQPPGPAGAPRAEAGVGNGAAAGAGGGTHCGSWLGAMMAQLLPRELVLFGFALSPRDMVGFTRSLAGIRSLDLCDCRYSLTSLPLLGGLGALEELRLQVCDWAWSHDQVNKETLEAAFLGLTAPAARSGHWLEGEADVEALYENAAALPLPRLQMLVVTYGDDHDDVLLVREALAEPTLELARRRPKPARLILRLNDNDDE